MAEQAKPQTYTIKIVPDAGDTTHSITLSAPMIRYGLVTLAALALLFVDLISAQLQCGSQLAVGGSHVVACCSA